MRSRTKLSAPRPWLDQHQRQRHLDSGLATLKLRGGSDLMPPAIKTSLAFTAWYLLSIVYSIANKQVLTVWNFPCVFAVVQLLVGALWISLLWMPLPTFGLSRKRFVSLRAPPELNRADLQQVSIIALFLALGHVLSTVAPAYGTVAFTNVVKTLEPLFTCLFSAVFLGQIFPLPVYLTLLPVIAGVIIASANEVSFSWISLISGLLSNIAFALRAISAKQIMQQPIGKNLHAQNLYGVLTVLALVTLLPLALLVEGSNVVPGTLATIKEEGLLQFLKIVGLAGVSHYLYNECAFLALSSVHPVTHAVANTVKRIAVIVVSVLYFNNPLTTMGMIGSAIAIVGVFLYSLSTG